MLWGKGDDQTNQSQTLLETQVLLILYGISGLPGLPSEMALHLHEEFPELNYRVNNPLSPIPIGIIFGIDVSLYY